MDRPAPPTLIDTLIWLVEAGLAGRSERGLTEGLATRLVAQGLPVDRISMGSDVLDPVLQSRSFLWRKGQGTEKQRFGRGLRRSDAWLNSILHWMVTNGVASHHLRLDSEEASRFALLPTLREEGYRDYYVQSIAYGGGARSAGALGLMASFASRADAGFSPDHLATIRAVLPAFALAFMAQANTRMTRRVLSTYLGDRPAQSVLSGQITRGETQAMQAVIWMSDIEGYTEAADRMRREGILEFLNAYAEIVADQVYSHGGEVLKFIGDGVLAVFDSGADAGSAARAALEAARKVQQQVAALRETREAAGKPAADIVISLHHGDVLFGNFGSADRLDFTALGSAVDEASRLVTLAKTLEQTVICSSAFKAALGGHDEALVSLGRYVLRSVSGAHHLYTIDPERITPPEGEAR